MYDVFDEEFKKEQEIMLIEFMDWFVPVLLQAYDEENKNVDS